MGYIKFYWGVDWISAGQDREKKQAHVKTAIKTPGCLKYRGFLDC
jgi:hypothetical protein